LATSLSVHGRARFNAFYASRKLERVGFSMTDDRRQALGLEGADFGLELRPKNIGARVKRVEDRRLLTGQGAFTGDRIVPGALYIAFRRSDHAHALISSIGTSTAAAMPGVIGVYTARELNGLIEPVYATSRLPDYHSTALYPLAREKVRYVGEPVVAVVAESRYRAEEASERVEIAYEPPQTVIDPGRVSTPERKCIGARSKNASRAQAVSGHAKLSFPV
jgi:aerobic carbon-monoxide dehydrogenase large subunit